MVPDPLPPAEETGLRQEDNVGVKALDLGREKFWVAPEHGCCFALLWQSSLSKAHLEMIAGIFRLPAFILQHL